MNAVADSSCDEYRVGLSSPGHKSETILRGLRRFDPSLSPTPPSDAVSEIMPRRNVSQRLRNLCLSRYLLLTFCIPPSVGIRLARARARTNPLRSRRAITREIYNTPRPLKANNCGSNTTYYARTDSARERKSPPRHRTVRPVIESDHRFVESTI